MQSLTSATEARYYGVLLWRCDLQILVKSRVAMVELNKPTLDTVVPPIGIFTTKLSSTVLIKRVFTIYTEGLDGEGLLLVPYAKRGLLT